MVGSGIVDQNVDAAAGLCRRGHGIRTVIGREIDDRNLGPSARRKNRAGDRICPAVVTTVNDDDGTFGGEEFGNRLTQSGARSGHQCALSRKSQIHVRPSFAFVAVAIDSSRTSTREPGICLGGTKDGLRLKIGLESEYAVFAADT
jgi:hypothetical protein